MSYHTFVDRAKIIVNGEQYLSDTGFITSVNITTGYNNQIVGGMSMDGYKTGVVSGNKSFSFSWTEYMPDLAQYINWNTFLLANPDTTIQIIPFSLFSNIPQQVIYTCNGIVCTSAPTSLSSEGSAATRTLSFDCIFISNL